MRNQRGLVLAAGALLLAAPLACFDAGDAPSCTISCAVDADCPGSLACSLDGKCSVGAETCTSSCTPGDFVNCSDAETLQACNATGDGLASTTCGTSGCNADAERCNVCVPDAATCLSTMLSKCATDGSGLQMTDCGLPGCNEAAGRCNACVPSSLSCSGNNLMSCDVEGVNNLMEACQLTCVDKVGATAAHCAHIEPKWMTTVCNGPALTDDLIIDADATYDTSNAAICTGGMIQQAGAPDLCVIKAGTITLTATHTLKLKGSRAFAFVASGALTIRGTIDASADGYFAGPGGSTIVHGAGGSSLAGGAGASFAQVAGAGGSTTTTTGGTAGPVVVITTADIFSGGPRTNFGAGTTIAPAPNPGGGGGGVQLVSCSNKVLIDGTIDAGGGGGGGGGWINAGPPLNNVYQKGGSGGGAGGFVVLQGASVELTASAGIFANGGGGGGGCQSNGNRADSGSDGGRSVDATQAGGCPFLDAGPAAGGAGGSLNGTAGLGGGGGSSGSGGGGGGSYGRLHIYTPTSTSTIHANAVVSPAFEVKSSVQTN